MSHIIDCPPTGARKLPANTQAILPRAILYIAVITTGFAAAWNADSIRTAFQFEAATPSTLEWHGNVRRSNYGD